MGETLKKIEAKLNEVVVGKKSLTIGETIGLIVAIFLVAQTFKGKWIPSKFAIPIAFAVLVVCLILF
ncbi:MAG: hypothetical protein DRJ69_04625 [Thermoprotei archaeon]|nr:MAG: hypothetical protein DRJ69_04625 [Thermoprotei archaeon]